MSIDAMKQALEALEECALALDWVGFGDCRYLEAMRETGEYTVETTPAITALRQAIEQAEQHEQAQPVAWRWEERINGDFDSWVISVSEPPPYAIKKQPLYTAPPPRQPLTDEEIKELTGNAGTLMQEYAIKVARVIEAAHGIKGES